MPTIGLVVLIGAVLLVAAVWLTPIDRAIAKPAVDGPSDPSPAAGPAEIQANIAVSEVEPARDSTAAASEPTSVAMPVLEIERLTQPATAVTDALPLLVSDDDATLEPGKQVIELPARLEIRTENGSASTKDGVSAPDPGEAPTGERPASSATHSALRPSYTARPARQRKLSSAIYPLTSTATNAVDGGAVSRSAYPMAIPIPIAMTVAEMPAPTSDSSPSGQPILPLWRRSDAQVHTSSSNGSSVSWSPHHPAEDGDINPALQVWQGSQSVAAHVSSTELGARDENVRKGLLIAAGVVVALAVASRR